VLIRLEQQEGDEQAQQAAVAKVKEALGPGVEYRRTEFVGPQVSEELFWDGIYAVSAAILAILVYIWFRFEWQFGLAAVIALLHDVLSTIGIFSLVGLEFNLTTVAAVLTIAGYSINDTVVVFDRVRENLRKYKSMPLRELFNLSINQTLSRTTLTSFTTLLALVALYTLGGEVIRGFSFGMIWGVVIGTYSSICLAVPLLLYLHVRRGTGTPEAAEKKTVEQVR
jgi:preprotein translocase subunit SecF